MAADHPSAEDAGFRAACRLSVVDAAWRCALPVSLYDRLVLPRLIDKACGNEGMGKLRARIVPRARGRVLEVGIGSGHNLPHYGALVTSLVGVDPSAGLAERARARIAACSFPVEHLRASAEELPLPAASIDTIVVTWTLCSIPDVYRALREMRRVLRPHGELLFIEHGAAPDRSVSRWQWRLQPLWKPLTGGCHLTRRIDLLLDTAGFDVVELDRRYVEGPKIAACFYQGSARRR